MKPWAGMRSSHTHQVPDYGPGHFWGKLLMTQQAREPNLSAPPLHHSAWGSPALCPHLFPMPWGLRLPNWHRVRSCGYRRDPSFLSALHLARGCLQRPQVTGLLELDQNTLTYLGTGEASLLG